MHSSVLQNKAQPALSVLAMDVGWSIQTVRTILQELTRIANHLLHLACHAGDVGCLLALLLLP